MALSMSSKRKIGLVPLVRRKNADTTTVVDISYDTKYRHAENELSESRFPFYFTLILDLAFEMKTMLI